MAPKLVVSLITIFTAKHTETKHSAKLYSYNSFNIGQLWKDV